MALLDTRLKLMRDQIDVSGELIRENVVEKEPGVALTYEVQVLDVNTCEPVVGVMLEMWHCNSTVSSLSKHGVDR
jgi:protocatechuate 3,4-dioxygenase beta subunit